MNSVDKQVRQSLWNDIDDDIATPALSLIWLNLLNKPEVQRVSDMRSKILYTAMYETEL